MNTFVDMNISCKLVLLMLCSPCMRHACLCTTVPECTPECLQCRRIFSNDLDCPTCMSICIYTQVVLCECMPIQLHLCTHTHVYAQMHSQMHDLRQKNVEYNIIAQKNLASTLEKVVCISIIQGLCISIIHGLDTWSKGHPFYAMHTRFVILHELL